MQVFWDINRIEPRVNTVLTLGTFDGVHRGHQAIVRELQAFAQETKAVPTLVTLEPHPRLVLAEKEEPAIRLLTTIEEKIDALSKLELDRLVVANFSSSFAALEPQEFISDILVKKLKMKHIIIGQDHAFGRNRSGNIELLQKLGNQFKFGVTVVKPIRMNRRVVSSTQIRNMLLEGEVEQAAELLGRDYNLRGQVVKGDGRGRQLGYPTANIRPFSRYKLIPKVGIYATRIKVGQSIFNSATYIGLRPTFNLEEKVIEVHLMNFDSELYGQEIELSFIRFIRDDIKFDTIEQLIIQIEDDKKRSLELLTQLPS
jgi:riboflavin kinase/FMN adenylyltransferase